MVVPERARVLGKIRSVGVILLPASGARYRSDPLNERASKQATTARATFQGVNLRHSAIGSGISLASAQYRRVTPLS